MAVAVSISRSSTATSFSDFQGGVFVRNVGGGANAGGSREIAASPESISVVMRVSKTVSSRMEDKRRN
ncbi:hypothetical protein SDJN02_04048, partial [Cucurbita argyrosperma subsp. argyrosperma]